ncbi:MAG TPA: SMC-Scp complex subunit ScpB [bacterium]
MDLNDLKGIIESLIFVADSPITIDELKNIVDGANRKEIEGALEELVAELNSLNRSFCIEKVANGFQLRTKETYANWIRKYLNTKPARLTRPALETLAVIAYKQPVTRTEIESIRGVDSGGVIKTLLERKLIKIMGKLEVPGRPLVYGTTRDFLELFGFKDIKDLPTLKDYEDLAKELMDKKINGIENMELDPENNSMIGAESKTEKDEKMDEKNNSKEAKNGSN